MAIVKQPELKNWKGQEFHPIDSYCWFKTEDSEREKGLALYNTATDPNPIDPFDREEAIKDLLDWAREQKANETEFFSDGD